MILAASIHVHADTQITVRQIERGPGGDYVSVTIGGGGTDATIYLDLPQLKRFVTAIASALEEHALAEIGGGA